VAILQQGDFHYVPVPGCTVALAGKHVEAYGLARCKRFAQFLPKYFSYFEKQKIVVTAVKHLLFGRSDQDEKGRIGVENNAFLVLAENQFGAILQQRVETDLIRGKGKAAAMAETSSTSQAPVNSQATQH
jgi:hypothetical protein